MQIKVNKSDVTRANIFCGKKLKQKSATFQNSFSSMGDSRHVFVIFNTSLSTGEVPILWKCSNIISNPKVKQPLCESDTRPISWTPIKVYFALIRSVLEYCCPVWHNALPVKLSDSIERVQKRALRIIFPALHYQEALATTGCVSLHTRRMELCSKLFTKIKEPESRLRHLVPPTRSQAHGRSLRNKDRPSLISCKTESFKWSFFRAMCLYAHGM